MIYDVLPKTFTTCETCPICASCYFNKMFLINQVFHLALKHVWGHSSRGASLILIFTVYGSIINTSLTLNASQSPLTTGRICLCEACLAKRSFQHHELLIYIKL